MEIFEQNLSLLKKYHSYINIEKFDYNNKINIIKTRNNSYSFKIGNTTFHSTFDPVKEGYNFFEKKKNLINNNSCPVFLGTGFFFHITPFIDNLNLPKLILIENNIDIFVAALRYLDLSNLLKNKKITFIIDNNENNILNKLTKSGIKKFTPILYPPYLKVYTRFYSKLLEKLSNSSPNIFEKLKYGKFNNQNVKILLISSKYFLMGEIISALKELQIEYEEILLNNDEFLTEDFIKILTQKIKNFKPDFTFTINHLGVDREGILMNLFEKIEMPLISWYVDNPNLIIKHFKNNISDYTTLLVWDKDNISDMKNIGFKNVFYLPLGVDCNRFKYISIKNNPFKHLKNDIIFVGNSMIEKVKKSYDRTNVPERFLKFYKKIAIDFAKTNEKSVENLIAKKYPDLYTHFKTWDNINKTNFETTVTWEATRIYRYKCVKETLDFFPLIVGDIGWKNYFRDKCKYFREVNYYTELPLIYNLATINFNTTSLQMKNAVNQRVFDVPASKRFIITDYRKQLENLFEIDKEVICYKKTEEIPCLLEYFLKNKKKREEIVKNAYKRVFNKHRYTNRVKEIISIAKSVYK